MECDAEKFLEYEKRLSAVESRAKSNTHRINEHDEALKDNGELIVAIKELALETKHMREDLNDTIDRLDKLESKDLDKWEKFKWLLVAGIVTIVLGVLAFQMGLK